MKKILYSTLYNSGGHISSCRAVIAAMDELKLGPFEQKMIDFSLKIKTFWTDIAYAYTLMNEYFPWSWKALYYFTNSPGMMNIMYGLFYPLFYARKFPKILEEENPDIIVSMCGPPTRGLVRAVKDMGKPTPIITIILDPITLHASWVDPEVDCVVAATPEAKELCLKFGMPEEKIKVFGMPIHPKFLKNYGTKEELRKKLGLDPQLFTILLMGGGAGIGRIFNLAKILDASDLKIQLIVVAGFNKKLETRFRQAHFRFPAKIFGFTDKIPELMDASDAIITKAGPGAVFEAIAKELPLIITGNIPGQEEANLKYVLKNEIGIVARKPEKLLQGIRQMQSEGIEKFRSNMRRIKNPNAVYEIAKLIGNYLH